MVDKTQFGTKTEAEMEAERRRGAERMESKKLHRRLLKELHPDQGSGRSDELKKEGEELAKDLNRIYDYYTKNINEADIEWTILTRDLRLFEDNEVVDYRERVKKYQKANGNQDPGKKDKPLNKKEFFAKHPVYVHHFDKEGSSFYIKDYIESTGEVVIELKLNGSDFKEKTISTVAEFEKLLDEVEIKKEKTLKEIFEPQPGGAKQNKQEAGNQKKYATETEYKNYLEKEFGALNQPHTDDDGVSLRFEKYFVKNDEVAVSIVGFDGEKSFKKKLSREAFEEFIRKPVGSRGTIEELFNLKRKKKKAEQKPEEEKKEPDAEKPEEEKSEMNEEEKKSAEELEKEKVVTDARSFYARTNFQAEGAYSRLKRILGKTFNKKVEDVPDVAQAYQDYQEKLKELREFKMNALKDKYLKLSPEERKEKAQEMKSGMEQLVIYFNYDEKIRLYESRTSAGAEAQKEHVGGKILAKSAEWVNRYRKMGWKKKLLISGVLIGVGVGATMLGATTVGFGVGFLKISQRALGGAVAGVGTAGLMETLARKSQKKEAEAKKKAIFDEFEVEDERNEFDGKTDDKANWEEKLHAFETKLDEEINSYAESLKNERGSVNMRLIAGLGVTAIIATGGPGYLMKWGLGLDSSHGNFHWLSDKLGITKPNINLDHTGGIKPGIAPEQAPIKPNIPPVENPSHLPPIPEQPSIKPNIPPVAPSGQNAEQIFKAPKNIDTEKLVPGSVEKTLDGVEVKSGTFSHDVVKDDNVERIIIRQKLAEGMSRPEANRLAHVIATNPKNLESIEKLKLIHPGDKVIVDWEKGTVRVDRLSGIKGHIHTHSTGASHEPKLAGNHPQAGATEINKPKVGGLNPTEHMSQAKTVPGSAGVENINEARSNMPSGGEAIREAALRDEMMQKASENPTGGAVNLTPEEQLKYQASSEKIQKNIPSMPRSIRGFKDAMLNVEKLRIVAHNGTPAAVAYETAYIDIVKEMSEDVCFDDNAQTSLDSLKNASADDYWQNDGKLNPKVIQLKAFVARRFGEEISDPRSGETVPKWIQRLTCRTLKEGGVNLESFVKLKTRH